VLSFHCKVVKYWLCMDFAPTEYMFSGGVCKLCWGEWTVRAGIVIGGAIVGMVVGHCMSLLGKVFDVAVYLDVERDLGVIVGAASWIWSWPGFVMIAMVMTYLGRILWGFVLRDWEYIPLAFWRQELEHSRSLVCFS